ncbi:MAG: sensor histidine kinase [Gulosibacter sp.]|uniref:sensor histidine kinase n=1 Tax=Gulosibacter sp. TaxID=2817531 RepID=UPI003F90656C
MPSSSTPERKRVFDLKLLDTLFILAMILLTSRFPGGTAGLLPFAFEVTLIGVVLVIGMWIWWRIRRAKGQRSSILAIVFAVLAISFYLVANNVSSLGLQWIAVLVLALELGVIASVAYAGVIVVLTLGVHVFFGSGLFAGLFEGLASAVLLGVGVQFALLIRHAERVDAERLAALQELEHANTELARAFEEQRLQHGRDQDLVIAEERARVATGLHDGLGHRLTAIGMSLDFSDRMRDRDPERAAAEVRAARATSAEALDEMRRVVRAMHPVNTDADNIAGSLESVAKSFGSTGLTVRFSRTGDGEISPETGLILLRFAQEALTNVVRHSGASQVELALAQSAAEVELAVRDDGESAEPFAAGFGIRSLQERAQATGGMVDAQPGQGLDGGFALSITLPTTPAQKTGYVHPDHSEKAEAA